VGAATNCSECPGTVAGMVWILAFHVIFMVCWFAGLFYLPRLFVYHAQAKDQISIDRFKLMERRLFWGIMTPAGILTTLLGYWYLIVFLPNYRHEMWMHLKLICVLFLWIFHICCGVWLQDFSKGRNPRPPLFYRWANEVPTVFLVLIIVLVIVKP